MVAVWKRHLAELGIRIVELACVRMRIGHAYATITTCKYADVFKWHYHRWMLQVLICHVRCCFTYDIYVDCRLYRYILAEIGAANVTI